LNYRASLLAVPHGISIELRDHWFFDRLQI